MNNNIIFNNLFALRKSIYLLLAVLLFGLIYLSQQQKIEFFDVKNVVYQTSSDNLRAKNSGLIIGGAIMIMLGIIGEYLWRIYDDVKDRPLYVIEKQSTAGSACSDVEL